MGFKLIFMKKISKRLRQFLNKYNNFKEDELTSDKALFALLKYIYANFLLYGLKKSLKFKILNKIKIVALKGDGILGNYYSGLQDSNDSLFLLHFLKKGDVFFDIGANVGHFTLLGGCLSQTKVVSIEPVPETFKRLTRNVQLNSFIYPPLLQNIGLSDNIGLLKFSNSLHTTNRVVDNANRGVVVNVETLDSLIAKLNMEPLIIKIDVEGYEYFILKGAIETLKSECLKGIIIELNSSGEKYGINEDDIISLLTDNGFYSYFYDFGSRQLIKIEDKNQRGFNTVFLRDIDFIIDRIKKGNKVRVGNREY